MCDSNNCTNRTLKNVTYTEEMVEDFDKMVGLDTSKEIDDDDDEEIL